MVYLIVVLVLLVGDLALNWFVDVANLRHADPEIPEEFRDWYDAEKYATSQCYLADSTRFDLFSSTLTTGILVAFILLGGFAWVDGIARAAGGGVVLTGLCFGGLLILLAQVLNLPFKIYDTFVIEERYGFNKTTPGTFVADLLKGLVLTALLGGVVFALVIWFFTAFGTWAWLIAWVAVTLIQFVIIYIAPVVIMPLFNKFVPLDEGELKDSIVSFSERQGFLLKGIFTMDGSRRSTKSNAYFTGFGRWRRIVLYDTLVEKHTVPELVSVFAHEVGHYKLKHIPRMLGASILSTGLMFYILQIFISQDGLYEAFGVATDPVRGADPVYAGLVFFGFLYTPISMVLSIVVNLLSRKHEFEADAYAVGTYGDPEAMVTALKKLSVDNLSNLTPHPVKVFLEYSHPPVLERIKAIRAGT